MADEYRFDDDGAPPVVDPDAPTQAEVDSPALDFFTAVQEDGIDAAVEAKQENEGNTVTIVHPRPEIVAGLQELIAYAVTTFLSTGVKLLHREAEIALANAFLWIANNELTMCDLVNFHPNREATLNIVGIIGESLMNVQPSVAQLEAEDAITETVQ